MFAKDGFLEDHEMCYYFHECTYFLKKVISEPEKGYVGIQSPNIILKYNREII